MSGTKDCPVLHVVVIGFHHKKGCQVEYSYPPLIPGNPLNSHEIPSEWKHLPSLALPDGAHNYTKDTTFFHLPARDGDNHTVYGVACYRQMDAKDLINRTIDVTRSTVQKSVCVLSRLPLYGLIKAKLELITHAYFDERDFSKVGLLEDTYNNLSLSLMDRDSSQIFLGLSVRNVVAEFRHKIVVLFKLLLLERRVLFSGAPVEDLSNVLLTIISLLPGMIEFGLEKSACRGHHKQISPTLHSTNIGGAEEEFMEVRYKGEDSKVDAVLNSTNKKKHVSRIHSTGRRSVSHEPESPEMTRDIDVSVDLSKSGLKSENDGSEVCDKITMDPPQSEEREKMEIDVNNQISVYSPHKNLCSHKSLQRSLSLSTDSKKPVRGERKRTTSCNMDEYKEQVVVTEDTLNLTSMTQIEVVQTGQMINNCDSVINIEQYSHEMELNDERLHDEEISKNLQHLSITLDDSQAGRIHSSDSVEELDSPESIIKIDREDCFSWEEDRLFLKIGELENEAQNSQDEAQYSSSTDERVTVVDRFSGNVSETKTKGETWNGLDDANRENSSTSLASTTSDQSSNQSTPSKRALLKNKLTSAFGSFSKDRKNKLPNQTPSPMSSPVHSEEVSSSLLQKDEYGFPLAIFTKGTVCYPYLSLQYLDILQDVNIRSFVIGATNVLFKQKKHLSDVIIEVSECRIDVHDRELQKLLQLTTADLRFADLLVKAVIDDKTNEFLDDTEWEGSDEWLRAQFRMYILSLLASVQTEDTKVIDDFGFNFVHAWKTTHNYRVWSSTTHDGIQEVLPGHPCTGQIGMGDLKVRLAHTMQSTERGKKLNAAVSQTGKYMAQTGKAVGGALSNAKTAVSSWFSSWKTGGDKNQPDT
ncbi:hypothetical protein ScPMuIL_016228 [Solemya velum]